MPNPYRKVHALTRKRRGGSPAALLPLVAAVLATPLAQPVLLAFLETGRISGGTEAIAFRMGALVAAAMSLHTYSDLVRGPDRPVLDPHPVQARKLLAAIAIHTARRRAYLPLICAILLLPVGLTGHWLAWGGACAVVLGCWLGMLGVGFAIHLGGVWAGLSPAFAGVLDAVRGDSPRTQAALIYAPGVALMIVGLAAGLASAGVGAALDGWPMGWLYLLLPASLGVVGALVAGPLADRCYVRATALLTEIDGMFSGVDEASEVSAVYLEWIARRDPELLRALRQGWRRLRLWPMGAWFLGLLGALAGWQNAADAPIKVLLVSGAAVLLLGALPSRLAEGDPRWLDRALCLSPLRVGVARFIAALAYAQGAILPPAATLWIRHGQDMPMVVAQIELLAVIGAATGAILASRWRGQALWLYGPGSLLLWALAVGRLFP